MESKQNRRVLLQKILGNGIETGANKSFFFNFLKSVPLLQSHTEGEDLHSKGETNTYTSVFISDKECGKCKKIPTL